MEQHRVVPDVIAEAPKETARIEYGEVEVQLGAELTPRQVQNVPKVTWSAQEDSLYTLLLTDQDVPEHFSFRQFNHWLVVNIPGHDITNGNTVYDYIGSGPPKDSGLHRYVFLVYKQTGPIDKALLSELPDAKVEDRGKCSAEALSRMLQLGSPVAGNFYRAQYDDSVPELYKLIENKYRVAVQK